MMVENELNMKNLIHELKSLKELDRCPGVSQVAPMRKMVKMVSGCKSHGKGLFSDRGSGGRENQSIFSSFAKVLSMKKDWKEEQLTLESISKDTVRLKKYH